MASSNLPLSLRAYRLKQPAGDERSLYLTKIPVKYLIAERDFFVDKWDPKRGLSKEQGYQRVPTRTRLLKLARFVEEEKNALFPTTVLLSSRERIEFITRDGDVGTIKVKKPLWIVDGQHRIYGLRLAIGEKDVKEWEKYELPVVILDNFDKEYETLQFFVLNTTQKRVSTDLAQRLLRKIGLERRSTISFSPGDEWISKALQVVDLLNDTDEKDNIWYARIKLPNTDRKAVNIINQTSMVSSLKPLLKEGALQGLNPDLIYKVLKNYWAAIRNLMLQPFYSPREYVIQKTPGVFSLHDLANRVIINKIVGSDYTKERFQKVLESIFSKESFGDEVFWRARGEGAAVFNSMKGFKVLADQMERRLLNEDLSNEIKV